MNGIPGWKGLQEATGVDVAGAAGRLSGAPSRVTTPGRCGRRRPARVPARGERPKARAMFRPSGTSTTPGTRTSWRALWRSVPPLGARRSTRWARPSGPRWKPPGAGPSPTPIWASCSSWHRWPGLRCAGGGTLRERLRAGAGRDHGGRCDTGLRRHPARRPGRARRGRGGGRVGHPHASPCGRRWLWRPTAMPLPGNT